MTLAAALFLAGCRGDEVTAPQVEDVGAFIATIHTSTDTSASGTAKYHYLFGQAVRGVKVTLSGTGGRYALEIAQESFRAEVGNYSAGLDSSDFQGVFSLTRGGVRVDYRIEGGTVEVTELTSRKFSGKFSLNGVAIDGSNPGAPALTTGFFTAYCEGECPNIGTGGGTDSR